MLKLSQEQINDQLSGRPLNTETLLLFFSLSPHNNPYVHSVDEKTKALRMAAELVLIGPPSCSKAQGPSTTVVFCLGINM